MADAFGDEAYLEGELARLKADKRKLNEELKRLGSAIKDATARAEKAERAQHEAEDKLAELSAGLLSAEQLADLQKRADQGAIDAEELKKIRKQLAEQEELEKKIEEAKAEIEKQENAAKEALKIAEDSKELADTANEQLQKKQAELEAKIKELTAVYAQLAKTEAGKENAEMDASFALKKIEQLEKDLEEERKLTESAAAEVLKMEKLLEEKDDEISLLTDERDYAREELDKAEDLVANYEVQIEKNYQAVLGLTAQLAEARKNLADAEKKLGDFEYAHGEAADKIEGLRETVKKAEDAKKKALAESTELRRQKGEAEKLVETIKAQLEEAEKAKAEAEKIAREGLLTRMATTVAGRASAVGTTAVDDSARIAELEKEAKTRQGYLRESADKLKIQTRLYQQSKDKLQQVQKDLEGVRSANAEIAGQLLSLNEQKEAAERLATDLKSGSLEAEVVKLVYQGFKVAQGEKKSRKNLFNAEKKAKEKDKDAQDAYDKQVRKAKKKGSTVFEEIQLPNDGYTKIVEAIVAKYHEYLATNAYTDEEERAYESKLLGTTVDASIDRNKVATKVVEKVLSKETEDVKSNQRAWKIALPSAAAVLTGVLVVAVLLGVGKAGVEADLVGVNQDRENLISWSQIDNSFGELSGGEIYENISQAYGSLQSADAQADKINAIFSPKATSAQGYSKVGSVIYATTSSENATDYLRVKNAVSAGEDIKTNADAVLAEYNTALSAYAEAKEAGDIETAQTHLETAQTANATLATYKTDMAGQVTEAEKGINELLVLAGMTMEEIEYVYSLMISPVLYVDIDEQQLLNNNTLFTNNDNGRALQVLSCSYDKKTNKVNMIVECMGANRQKYFNYVTFKTESEYSVIDQYELIGEMKEATTRSTAYDRELETDIEGTTVKANINGVDVEGVADLKWSLSKKVDKKSGTVTVNGSALVVLTDANGKFVSFQMFDVKKDFSTSDSSADMEETIKQMLVEQISKELGISISLIDGSENENA